MSYCDEQYIIEMRRKLHQYPEVGYELYKTCEIVGAELNKMGLTYTGKYIQCSLVGDITVANPKKTVAIRADMDALPVLENTDLPYKSKIEGNMHACGHDAHTATILGVVKYLSEHREQLRCNVRFIFQPNEEGPDSAPEQMVPNGAVDGVDEILAFHVGNDIDCGKIGYCRGAFYASCRNFTIVVNGSSTHATTPQLGADALGAAAQICTNIQMLRTRALDPLKTCICTICSLNSGNAHNVIPEQATMLGTLRTYDLDTDRDMWGRINRIAKNIAANYGCTVDISSNNVLPPVVNSPELVDRVMVSARKALGAENVFEMPKRMCSEDFADFATAVPASYFNLGTGKVGSDHRPPLHRNDFVIEESALKNAADAIIQYLMDI